jgi:hypothetical protein
MKCAHIEGWAHAYLVPDPVDVGDDASFVEKRAAAIKIGAWCSICRLPVNSRANLLTHLGGAPHFGACRSMLLKFRPAQSEVWLGGLMSAGRLPASELRAKNRVIVFDFEHVLIEGIVLSNAKGVVIDALTGERVSLESTAASGRLTMYDDRASAEAGTGHVESGGSGDDVDSPDVSASTKQRAARPRPAPVRGATTVSTSRLVARAPKGGGK